MCMSERVLRVDIAATRVAVQQRLTETHDRQQQHQVTEIAGAISKKSARASCKLASMKAPGVQIGHDHGGVQQPPEAFGIERNAANACVSLLSKHSG